MHLYLLSRSENSPLYLFLSFLFSYLLITFDSAFFFKSVLFLFCKKYLIKLIND